MSIIFRFMINNLYCYTISL